MIKTLRVTGVAAVALAGVVLASVLGPASLIHFGGRDDQQMQKIIASPSAVERFREQYGDKNQSGQDTTPLLVRQAETFKDIIDPRLPTPTQTTGETTPSIPRPPLVKLAPTSQKFTLVGTSFIASDPQSSFAYIRLPDNTYQWVKCGSQVGYVIIKEVKKGSIICWDGRNNSEMAVDPVPNAANQLEVNHAASPAAPKTPRAVEVKVIENTANRPGTPGQPIRVETQGLKARLSPQEQEALGDLASKLKELNNRTDSNALDRTAASELIDEYKSSRVSPQETKRLENLGEERSRDTNALREEQRREFVKRFNMHRSSSSSKN